MGRPPRTRVKRDTTAEPRSRTSRSRWAIELCLPRPVPDSRVPEAETVRCVPGETGRSQPFLDPVIGVHEAEASTAAEPDRDVGAAPHEPVDDATPSARTRDGEGHATSGRAGCRCEQALNIRIAADDPVHHDP